MALEGVTLNRGAGGATIGTDQIPNPAGPTPIDVEVVKLILGADGVNGGLVTTSNPLPTSTPALTTGQTNQVTVGAAAVQLDAAPLANRKTIEIRALSTNL